MSNTIQPGAIKHAQSLGKNQANGGAAATDVDAGGVDRGDRAGAPDTGDKVQLTDSARALNAASQTHSSSGVVDAGHVQRVQQALASGTYQVHAGRIADKLIALEQQISGKG